MQKKISQRAVGDPGALQISPVALIRVAVSLPRLSTCPLDTNSGCGKERHIITGPW